MNNAYELAKGLQNSNIKEVADLAKAYLDLRLTYMRMHMDDVLEKHREVFEKLAENGD